METPSLFDECAAWRVVHLVPSRSHVTHGNLEAYARFCALARCGRGWLLWLDKKLAMQPTHAQGRMQVGFAVIARPAR